MPDFSLEDQHDGMVVGVDEVGRGPSAGPVVAAAVIFDRPKVCPTLAAALKDSKLLSARQREALVPKIGACAQIAIGQASVEEIDEINIFQASLLAMRRAVEGLELRPHVALIDGTHAPKLMCKTVTVIKGDSKSCSIAAASIIAKTNRDQLMQDLDQQFPQYGWGRNAGYNTREHLEALQQFGVTEHHRRSFAPVKAALKAA